MTAGSDDAPAIMATIALANIQNGCDPNRYEQTSHLSVDTTGNIYFADSNNQRILRITPQGNISTVAGNGTRPTTNGNCEPTGSVGDGPDARSALLYNPADVFALPNGDFLIADQQNNRIAVTIRKQGEMVEVFVGKVSIARYEKAIPDTLLFDAVSFELQGQQPSPNDQMFISNVKIVKGP